MSEALKTGCVISSTRRYIEVESESGEVFSAMAESKAMDIVTGDSVEFEIGSIQPVVKKVLPRKNCLIRCYRKTKKKLAANLDLVLIITAVKPLFNCSFLDRLITACVEQNINHSLVLNKIDLDINETKESLAIYQNLGVPIIQTSTKKNLGLNELRELLNSPNLSRVALVGISGVGKSSILNQLIPEADRKTGQVSLRTGQGKQVTTQSHAFSFKRDDNSILHLIDLPGLSSFGLTHLKKEEVQNYFREFDKFRPACQYLDCFHLKEPSCAVKDAVQSGQIADSRYQSYLEILDEIENAREY